MTLRKKNPDTMTSYCQYCQEPLKGSYFEFWAHEEPIKICLLCRAKHGVGVRA